MGSFAERRSQCRHQVNHFSVTIKSLQHHHHDWDQRSVGAIDFNRYGIAIETDMNVVVGDVLRMQISADEASVAEVEGLVCNRTQTNGGYRLGIRFEYQGDEGKRDTIAANNISEKILMMERQAEGLSN